MTAVSLLRLYPRAWRERYGDEFVATIGDGALDCTRRRDHRVPRRHQLPRDAHLSASG